MKKIGIICLALIIVFGNVSAVFAESGNLIVYDQEPGYFYEIDYPGIGNFVTYETYKTINGRTAFCLEIFTMTYDKLPYTTGSRFSYLSDELALDLELIAHFAWTLTPKRYEDYLITSLLIWDRLGNPLTQTMTDGRSNPTGLKYYNYANRKSEVFALVEQSKKISSLAGKTFTLQVGETITIDDTNGVLAKLLSQTATLHHTEFTQSGNKLTITGKAVGQDTYVFNRFKPEHLGATLFWHNADGYQDIATFAISNPMETKFSVNVVEPKGSIQLTKTGVGGTKLAGVEFSLRNSDGNEVATGVTDANGYLEFKDLPYDTFELIETTTAPGYIALSDAILITIDQLEAKVMTIENKPTVVEVIKTDRSGEPLAGAKLQLLDSNEQLVGEWESTTSAKVFHALPSGTYQLVEVSAPIGYRPASPLTLEVKLQTEPQVFSLVNEPGLGQLEISKTDISTSEPLPNTTISLYQADDTLISSQVTDESGQVVFEQLEVGEYYFLETEAPEGYILNPEKHGFEIIEHGQIIKSELSNQQITGTPVIRKQDFSTAEPLPETTIELYRADGELIETQITDEFGEAEFAVLPYGSYYFLEKDAPEGYVLNPEKHWFDIVEHGEIVTSIMTNRLIESDLEVTKTDISTAKPLSLTVIELYSEDDELIDTQVTDSDGLAKFTAITYGKYYFIEKEAPEGYVLNPDKHWFEVRQDGEIIKANMTNQLIHSHLEVSKRDLSTAEPLSLTLIELFNEDGELIDAKRTDESGIALFQDIPYGKYYFLEKEAPEGYVLNLEKHWFEIREHGEIIRATLPNQLITGMLELLKVNQVDKKPLAGATFEIFQNGQSIGEFTTDQDGLIQLELEYGEYEVKEINAPEGFIQSHEVWTFKVEQNGQIIELVIENEPIAQNLPRTGAGNSRGVMMFAGALVLAGLGIRRKKERVN